MRMRIAVSDVVSNTSFPVLAAEELGFFKAEGLDAHVELIAPVTKAISVLREGAADAFASGSVHAVLRFFPRWNVGFGVGIWGQRTFFFTAISFHCLVQY
jgi:hypothetical protein